MAQRLVTSTVLRPDGTPWAGAAVDFTLVSNAYTLLPDASYPLRTIRAVTDIDGQMVVTLAGGIDATWRVTMPDGETFFMLVGDGPTTTLETLRAAYIALVPEPPFDIEAFIESLVVAGGGQPNDADLTAIANLAPSNDDIIQRKSGAWTNRTVAQLKSDLALVKADVGLANVSNTSDADKPVSTATAAAIDAANPLLHVVTTSSTAVHTTTTETAFDQSFTVPANSLVAGDVLRLSASGSNSTHSSGTVSIRLRLKFGSVVVLDAIVHTLAVSSVYVWNIDWIGTVRTIGASGVISSAGVTVLQNSGTNVSVTQLGRSAATIDTTAAAALTAQVTHGASDAANTAQLSTYVLERLRA